jgi:general secretion pathway protein A
MRRYHSGPGLPTGMIRLEESRFVYTDWFKLRKLPFRLRPDPEFLYLDGAAGQVLLALRAALGTGAGTLCLIGEAGTGKTTLLHALAAEYRATIPVGRIQQPSLTATEMLEALCDQFNLTATAAINSPAETRLARFFAEESRHGRAVLVLVDEAHRASGQLLRALLELGSREAAPQIVLAGEPELSKSLAALQAHGLAVKLTDTLQLERLDATQVAAYLDHRLKVAGSNVHALFEADALAEIMRYTGGTPQLMNVLCDAAMNCAEAHSTQRVGAHEVRDAVQELRWVEFSARAAQSAANPAHSGIQRSLRRAVVQELEVLQTGRSLYRLTLKPGKLVIGRGEGVGLCLDSQSVSRRHCQLISTADQTYIEDLGSTNGIVVNGQRRRMHRLEADDKVVIGDHTLIYRESP